MRYDRLVAPAVSLFVVIALLIGARTYEDWPLKPRPCSLRTFAGIPCVGCGGTRSMQAMSHGDFADAVRFNPMVVLGVITIILWFVWTVATMKLARYQRDWDSGEKDGSGKKNGRRWGIFITVLVLLNWIYLICYLPP